MKMKKKKIKQNNKTTHTRETLQMYDLGEKEKKKSKVIYFLSKLFTFTYIVVAKM